MKLKHINLQEFNLKYEYTLPLLGVDSDDLLSTIRFLYARMDF